MIGSSENRISYNGNGIATEFAYTFKILEKSDIKVLHVANDGTEELLTKDYYVDMDKSVVLYPGYAPGEEIPEQNRPPILSEGEMLVIYREVPITQESALDKHWPFNVIEAGLDKLTIICQQLFDRLQRSFYVSESTSTNFDPKVPIEAGKTFRVKDDGTGFEVTEDPAKVLPLAQGVYTQTKEQAEFAKEQADASSEAANAAKTSETNAKNYSENVNVFLPSVSDDGVLSWTNKAGLANPASVNIKGAKGDTGDKGDTGAAATIEVGTVTTGAAGSSASVVNSGTASNVVLNFTLPRGKDGKDGGVTVDAELNDTSTNPIQNKAVKTAIDTVTASIPTKVSALENDAGYLTQHQSLEYEKYVSYVISGAASQPASSVMQYTATGAFTLNLSSISSKLAAKEATVFTAYIKSNADYTLTITNAGTIKYIGSASDVAITSAGLLLNIMMLKDASGNVTSIVQASKLS